MKPVSSTLYVFNQSDLPSYILRLYAGICWRDVKTMTIDVYTSSLPTLPSPGQEGDRLTKAMTVIRKE